jgi:ankyrin repeat protein
MEVGMPTRRLPRDPNLEHLKNEAKALHKQVRAGDSDAVALVREFHPQASDLPQIKLADAQLTIARAYGFPSWPRLRAHVETIARYSRSLREDVQLDETDVGNRFLRLASLNYDSDSPDRWRAARELLAEHPELARVSIHTIAAVGEVAAARELLEGDAAQARRAGGPYNWEPLLYACSSRHSTLEVSRLLLEHGADPNAGFLWEGNSPPFTALTGAFGYGEDAPNQPPHEYELELATLLLARGADPNDGQALYNNLWRGSNEHLELLFAYGLGRGDGGPWHRRLAPSHATPSQMLEDQLLFAADGDEPERVELLIRHGVDVNGLGTSHPTLRGRNAYELALANGATRVAELLAKAGAAAAPLDPVDELLAACMRGDENYVERLLASDPTLARAAAARDPARIATAAEHGRPDAVRLLVKLGFDINHKHRTTPLHIPAYSGDRTMVDLLIELGGDPTITDDEFDATPAGWAKHAHHDELAEHLADLEQQAQRRGA